MNTLKTIKKLLTKNKFFLLALITSIFCALPTIPFYYFGENVMYQSHDHVFHIVRLWHVEKALHEGILMPNWLTSMTFGLGSPVFLFSWFLPYYFGIPLRLMGFSLADSLKLLFLISYLLSGISIYLLCQKITNKLVALISIAFYLLSPFRLNLIFTRGGIGEAWAQVLIPAILLLSMNKAKKILSLMVLFLSALSLTHNISYIFTCGLLIFWSLLVIENKQLRLRNFSSILLSLIFTAYFWLPALMEREFTHYHETARIWYQSQFPTFKALIFSPWQYGPPFPEQQNLSMSFQIGKIHWLIICFLPVFIIFRKKLSRFQIKVIISSFLLFILSIFFQLKISKVFWDNIDTIKIFIFPWRLQSISILSISILSSFVIYVVPWKNISFLAFLLLLILANRHHFYAARGDYASDDYIKQLGHSGGSSGEFLPVWADKQEYRDMWSRKKIPPKDIVNENNDIILKSITIHENSIKLELEAKIDQLLILNHYYFPGWIGYLDNHEVAINNNLQETKGRMTINLPRGEHHLQLNFKKTKIRVISYYISLTSIFLYILIVNKAILFRIWKKLV